MSLRRPGRALLAASVLSLVALAAAACGSKSPGGFAPSGDDGGADGGGSGGDDGSSYVGSSGGSSGGSSSGLSFGDSGGLGLGNGTCKDGMYSGMFSCSFMYDPSADGSAGSVPEAGADDAGGFVITGMIGFELSQSGASGESFIDTASGMLSGNCCLDLFSLSATVGGTLDCNSGSFAGSLTMGTYTGFLSGTFNGPLTAGYDGTTSSFVNGAWNLAVPGEGNCVGGWTASYTGP